MGCMEVYAAKLTLHLPFLFYIHIYTRAWNGIPTTPTTRCSMYIGIGHLSLPNPIYIRVHHPPGNTTGAAHGVRDHADAGGVRPVRRDGGGDRGEVPGLQGTGGSVGRWSGPRSVVAVGGGGGGGTRKQVVG